MIAFLNIGRKKESLNSTLKINVHSPDAGSMLHAPCKVAPVLTSPTTWYLPFRILNETGAPAVMVGSERKEHEQLDDDTDKTGGGESKESRYCTDYDQAMTH